MVADELRRQADNFIELDELKPMDDVVRITAKRAACGEPLRTELVAPVRPNASAGLDLEPHRGHAPRRPARGGGHARPSRRARFHCGHTGAAIFHLKDFHEPLRDSAEIRRRLRDIYESCLDKRKFVVITSPVRFIPEEVERSVMFLELRRPTWSN